MVLSFEWNENKAKENIKKHKISFEEAKTVFNDPFLLTFPDPDHSKTEDRYINIGRSSKGRVITVIHTDRVARIRLISCRRATSREREVYEEKSF